MITVSEIKLPINHGDNDLIIYAEKILNRKIKTYKVVKRAVDARKKDTLMFVYTIEAEIDGNEESVVRKCRNKNISISKEEKYVPPVRKSEKESRTVVVGTGPAGLFCAYVLALAGMNPIVIERGKNVDERKADVDFFRKTGILDTSSNIQFGEGGAGTFSDGKLNTGIKDKRIKYVLETFAAMSRGKADDILWMSKPHIGTDRLIETVKNLRNEIIKLGAKVYFNTKLTGFETENGRIITACVCRNGENYKIPCDNIVLASGHSARDTFKMLKEKNIAMEQKPFAVGVRIEHKRKMIDESQYGNFAGNERLGAADYKLAVRPQGYRGVYTFCMCPGGEVVPASSEENMLAVNGMSESARNAENSNSALLVGIAPSDLNCDDVLAGVEFQRNIERKAFESGGGGYKAPCQLAGDILTGNKSSYFGSVVPSYKPGVTQTELKNCLPSYVIESIKASLPEFGKMIKGFDCYDAVLTGVESRSSSPLRIIRNGETLESVSVKCLYPCGEGAGYAGGIVSAAVDGIKCAEKIIEKDISFSEN